MLPATHRLAKAKAVAMHQLADLPGVVASGRTSPSLRNAMAELYERAHARLRPMQDADNVLGHLNMVRAGLGFAVLPEYVRAILPAGVVATELDWHPAPTVSVVVAHLKDGQLPIVAKFKSVLREALGLSPGSGGGRRRASAPGKATPSPTRRRAQRPVK